VRRQLFFGRGAGVVNYWARSLPDGLVHVRAHAPGVGRICDGQL
jgi:hypothetical protein